MTEVREFRNREEMHKAYFLLRQLQPDLEEAAFRLMLEAMIHKGYRMIGVFEKEECLALTGLWSGTKFYAGPYLEIDNFVVDAKLRAQGIGKLLLEWVEKEAREQGCGCLMLDAYTVNTNAHRFYFREGFLIKGFHFIKTL